MATEEPLSKEGRDLKVKCKSMAFYEVRYRLRTHEKEGPKAALVQFIDADGRPITEEHVSPGFSEEVGRYSYLKANPETAAGVVRFFAPTSGGRVTLRFRAWANRHPVLLGHDISVREVAGWTIAAERSNSEPIRLTSVARPLSIPVPAGAKAQLSVTLRSETDGRHIVLHAPCAMAMAGARVRLDETSEKAGGLRLFERRGTHVVLDQGLRAVAVGLVLIFHIWPSALPGGYVGVDVFFVISGYLITGLLVRAALRDGRISLLDFYARRARRLLPAATAVLAATFAGMFVFLPEARWEEAARQIAASALYVQNWMLAWLSVDYLGAENAASPVQHYWSLSIEEQFYFVWPLVMIGAIYLSRRFDLSLRRTFVVALSIIFVASLATSVLLTAREPAQAYFVTHTRMWELALGGLLALTIHRVRVDSQLLRAGMALVGFAAIVWSAFAYSPATPFPGTAALAPTIGTALLIVAGDVRLGFFRGLNAQWLTWIGDRSYSIYLWHWPLVVFYTVGTETVGLMDGLGLLALTLVLSHLCYEHIEQRYRHGQANGEWKPLAYGLASIVGCVAAAGALQYSIVSQAAIHVDMADARYPGPAALLTSAPVPDGVDAIPSLAALKRDLPVVYAEKCHQNQTDVEPISCTLGDPDGETIMAITGDSHAAHWVPALDRVAKASGAKLLTFTKSACAFSRVEVRTQGKPYTSCGEWRENVIDRIKELGVDTLFTSQSRYSYVDENKMAEGLRSVWAELVDAGVEVVPIRDTPWMQFEPGDCLAAGDPSLCTTPRREAEASDVFSQAASTIDGLRVIDMTDGICGPDTCTAIVGNIIVWRDNHHLSATYSEALGPYLAQQLGLPIPAGAAVLPATEEKKDDDPGKIAALLECNAVREGTRAVDRDIQLQLAEGKIAFRYGDWEKQKERYDLWLGTVQDGRVTMEGSYIEGAGGVKPVSMSGKIEKGQLLLKGKRGPRDCTVSAKVAIDTRA